jgi:hypothetical protein
MIQLKRAHMTEPGARRDARGRGRTASAPVLRTGPIVLYGPASCESLETDAMRDARFLSRRRLWILAALSAAGCAGSPPPGRVYVVFFEPFSAVPDANAATILQQAAEAAKAYADDPVQVIGFADPEGSSEENRRLSQARAEAVSAHLAQRGVAPSRIRRSARGATEPTLAMVESRRVEIRIGAPAAGPTEPYRG